MLRKQHSESFRDQKGKIDESEARYITIMQKYEMVVHSGLHSYDMHSIILTGKAAR